MDGMTLPQARFDSWKMRLQHPEPREFNGATVDYWTASSEFSDGD